MLNHIFTDKKDSDVSIKDAIAELQETEELLLKKIDFVEEKIVAEIAIARENVASNKVIALQALKRKKHYVKLQQHLDSILQATEYKKELLSKAKTKEEAFKIISADEMSYEFIRKHMDLEQLLGQTEMVELVDYDVEKDFVIYDPVKFGNDIEDADLLVELDMIEEEFNGDKIITVETSSTEKNS